MTNADDETKRMIINAFGPIRGLKQTAPNELQGVVDLFNVEHTISFVRHNPDHAGSFPTVTVPGYEGLWEVLL